MTATIASVFDFESTLQLIRKILPFNALNDAYLDRLLSSSTISVFCQGDSIAEVDGSDNTQLTYLLHGAIDVFDGSGMVQVVMADELNLSASLLPLDFSNVSPCTLIAKTDCALFSVSRELADELLLWNQLSDCLHVEFASHNELVADIHWKLSILKSSLFLKVSPLHVGTIIDSAVSVPVTQGDVIIREGDDGDHCYFIKRGRVEVYKGSDNNPTVLAHLGPGQCIGEDALLNQCARSASIRMLTDGELVMVSSDLLLQSRECPEVPSVSTADELETLRAQGVVLVDVRTEEEYQSSHLPMAINVPLGLLSLKAQLLDLSSTYVCYCATGQRAKVATYLLRKWGYNARALQVNDDDALQDTWRERRNYILRNGEPIQGRSLER